MFIQVIQGQCRDADRLHELSDEWRDTLGTSAEGWLGGTYGVTDDGQFVAVVRFDSREAAMRNSSRPEQGEWWEKMQACFEGEVTFHDCDDVTMFLGGGSDDAGFVQVMKGRGDRAALREVAQQADEILSRARPDVIGGTVAWPGDGTFIQTVYFTSEEEARANEKREPATDEEREAWERMGSLMQVDTFLDITDPWLFSV